MDIYIYDWVNSLSKCVLGLDISINRSRLIYSPHAHLETTTFAKALTLTYYESDAP